MIDNFLMSEIIKKHTQMIIEEVNKEGAASGNMYADQIANMVASMFMTITDNMPEPRRETMAVICARFAESLNGFIQFQIENDPRGLN